MINIISRSILSKKTSGPKKVAENLIKGLDIIGYPYCVNKSLEATSLLWIQDDPIALREASRLKLNAVVGPNIYILPRNIPSELDLSRFVYIHPSPWVVNMWKKSGFDRCYLDYWPTGIDTKKFASRPKPKEGTLLIYFKQRHQEELEFVKKILDKNKIGYKIFFYGSYEENDYIEVLKDTKYIVWLGRQESQGLALEEALSMNVPILVWDVLNIGHWVPNKKELDIFNEDELAEEDTTSAYYFDDRCGIKTKKSEEIADNIKLMEENWQNFEPRKYILENLSLEKQARDFIELFNKHYNISYEDGLNETLKTNSNWRNASFGFKVFIRTKEIIKKCVKSLKK